MKYKYIEFREIPSKGKTSIYECLNIKSAAALGLVKWYGPWRQFCYFPTGPAVYSKGCLDDINDFISKLMAARTGQGSLKLI